MPRRKQVNGTFSPSFSSNSFSNSKLNTGVIHGEEIRGLFYQPYLFPPVIKGPDRFVSDNLINFWYNFAAFRYSSFQNYNKNPKTKDPYEFYEFFQQSQWTRGANMETCAYPEFGIHIHKWPRNIHEIQTILGRIQILEEFIDATLAHISYAQ